jgi:hypothetical protein
VNAPGTEDVSHVIYFNTYFGNIDTTIPNDFMIPTGNGITVAVPTGANIWWSVSWTAITPTTRIRCTT